MKNGLLITLSVLLALAVLALGFVAVNPAVEVTNIPAPIVQVSSVEYNDSALKADVLAVQAKLNEEDVFEDACKALAVEEYSDDKFEEMFDFLVANNVSIEDKEDISSVVVKDDDVNGVDVDEGNCDVSHELKVYFEDSDGDDKKVYINVDTEIEDNDVEEQTFELA
jgi:hypothetical protein